MCRLIGDRRGAHKIPFLECFGEEDYLVVLDELKAVGGTNGSSGV